MASVLDIAAYILKFHGPLTALKLQKLIYYSQAWSLVWDDIELFDEEIEIRTYGPTVPELYEHCKGHYRITEISEGNAENLNNLQIETIESVVEFYGKENSQYLFDLIRLEDPWKIALNSKINGIITKDSLMKYYSSISHDY